MMPRQPDWMLEVRSWILEVRLHSPSSDLQFLSQVPSPAESFWEMRASLFATPTSSHARRGFFVDGFEKNITLFRCFKEMPEIAVRLPVIPVNR